MPPRRMTTLLGVVAMSVWMSAVVLSRSHLEEAPAGFDGESNGFITGAAFEEAKEEFTGPETIAEGLGPVFNAAGCGECHTTPVLGGTSQIFERRAGRFDGQTFFDHPGGSLIQDRATDPRVQERVLAGHNVIALRSTLGILGDGFVEAIDSNTLVAIRNSQPSSVRGTFIQVPVLEAPGNNRGGRFGWKNQHASLLSFSADAYKNEMGITSPMQLEENSFNGEPLPAGTDPLPEPEDDGADVQLFADFMRSTKVPPVDPFIASSSSAILGSSLFDQIGCARCHTREIVTAPPGTIINGGQFQVPAALGNKIIRPFSDFLLHDIGTGDGIVQNGGQSTRNQLRTAPLWGLRARGRLLHNGGSHNTNDAIQRHGGQATASRNAFNSLSSTDRNRVLTFLSSL
ncbi:MAG: di-heme oxidoredictase family protein [Vicinamibacterales bacterium]